MEIKIKERRKKSSKLVTDASTVDLSRPTPAKSTVLPPSTISYKSVLRSKQIIDDRNKEEVERTRKKLRDEVHSRQAD